MSEPVRVRITAELTVSVPHVFELDVEELNDWLNAVGEAAWDGDAEALERYFAEHTDDADEVLAAFPHPDLNVHDVICSELTDFEVLADSSEGSES